MDDMATDTLPIETIETAEPISVPAWAWLLVAVAAVGIYLMTLDNSVLGSSAEAVHELFHDARHFVGVPCH
jgi:hypothetical protein